MENSGSFFYNRGPGRIIYDGIAYFTSEIIHVKYPGVDRLL